MSASYKGRNFGFRVDIHVDSKKSRDWKGFLK